MCGRFYLKSPPSEVAALFGIDIRDNFPSRYNIAPTQPIAVIRKGERRQRAYALMRWGFAPEWAKGDHLAKLGERPLINARAETAADKPTFRAAFKRRRCLIPANGFYEWKAAGRTRRPFAVARADGALFAFAGLWETAGDPDGGEIDTVAILTTAAGPDIAAIHHRAPVMIEPGRYADWLDADERDIAGLADLTRPAPRGTWRAHEVSPAVGNVRNDGPHLIAPEEALPLFA